MKELEEQVRVIIKIIDNEYLSKQNYGVDILQVS
jgi:hypothetical protein